MNNSKQLTIAELILRLGSGVFGVSGLGILGIGCIYLINDTTGLCIGLLENIPKALTYSDELTKKNNEKIDLVNHSEYNIIIAQNNTINKYFAYVKSWSFNYLRRGLLIGGMIGGGVGLRFFGTWIGSEQVINWFNGKFGSNYIK
jgi:hypothetical protein